MEVEEIVEKLSEGPVIVTWPGRRTTHREGMDSIEFQYN